MSHLADVSSPAAAEGPALVEVRVSVPDSETARRVAEALVVRQDAACVHILGPMASVYTWKNEVHQAQEWLLLVKTTADAFGRIAELVRREHRYDVPEIIAVPIAHATADYTAWVRKHSDGIDDQEMLDA